MSSNPSVLERKLIGILNAFEGEVDGVRGSAVADREGLPVVSGFREPFDLTAMTGMSTLAVESAQKVFDYIGLRGLRTIVFEGEDAKVLIYDLGGGQASFITVVRPDANMGLVKFRMALAARRLEEELGFTRPTGPHVEEIFLMTQTGLLLSHASLSPVLSKDRDVFAGMLMMVQAFVKDSFGGKGGTLDEMEMANLSLRLVRGRWCVLAIVATARVSEDYVAHAKEALLEFEDRNLASLNPWNGDVDSLQSTKGLLEEVLSRRPG